VLGRCFIFDDYVFQKFSLQEGIVRLDIGAFLFCFIYDILNNSKYSLSSGVVRGLTSQNLHAFFNKLILDSNLLALDFIIQTVVHSDKEVNGLWDHFFILAFQSNVPYDV
jgi:hypothetical protein